MQPLEKKICTDDIKTDDIKFNTIILNQISVDHESEILMTCFKERMIKIFKENTACTSKYLILDAIFFYAYIFF